MSRINWITVYITLTMLTACATKNHSDETAKEAPAPVASVPAPVVAMPAPSPTPKYKSRIPIGAGGGIVKPLIPARSFCTRDRECGQHYGAFGYIIFTKRPTTDAIRQRYLSICRTFIANLEDVSGYAHIARSQIATTFWLLVSKPSDENSCEQLVASYDYARATGIAASIHKLKSAGPILVASGQPDVAQTETQQLLIIDLGKFTPSDMDRAFGIWKDKISQDSKYWGDVFNLDLIMAEFGSFIRKYGGTIVQTVKPG